MEGFFMRKLKILSGLIVAVVLVAGCINYDQNLILNEDGSGTIEVHYTSDDPTGEMGAPRLSFTEKEIEAEYLSPGIKVRNVKVSVPAEGEEGSHEAMYYVDFEDIANLNGRGVFAAKDSTGTKDAITQIFTLDEAGDSTTFTQTCIWHIDIEDTTGLEDYRFTYSLTCPSAVTMTNGKVKSDGLTVAWSYTLPELIKNPVKMYAVYGGSAGTGQGCVGPGKVSD
jgi:hypothetical protein